MLTPTPACSVPAFVERGSIASARSSIGGNALRADCCAIARVAGANATASNPSSATSDASRARRMRSNAEQEECMERES